MAEVDEDKLYRLVGQRIRDLRNQRTPKLTQSRLASLLEVERTSVTNIENGTQRPPLAFLYRLSVELNAPLAEILPTTEEVSIHTVPGKAAPRGVIPPKTAGVISRLSIPRNKASLRNRS
jgi:transcriptional regulator with XRE-family HTH domain